MSFTAVLRSAQRSSSSSLRRYVSSSAATPTPTPTPTPATTPSRTSPSASSLPQSSLPPKKLRALIALYHKADRFITPETLDNAIDRAFIRDLDEFGNSYSETTAIGVTNRLLRQRSQPRFGEGKVEHDPESMSTWSQFGGVRAKRVCAALYGLDDASHLPGLEMLQEEEERVQRDLQEDLKRT